MPVRGDLHAPLSPGPGQLVDRFLHLLLNVGHGCLRFHAGGQGRLPVHRFTMRAWVYGFLTLVRPGVPHVLVIIAVTRPYGGGHAVRGAGPVAVWTSAGRPVPIPGSKVRVLLAACSGTRAARCRWTG